MEKPLALSSAYATWVLGQHDDKWIVYDEGGNKLGEFPNTWKEQDCMIAIRLGRKYELEAFNTGIAFGKMKREETLLPKLEELQNAVTVLENMNIALSEKLEKFIIGEPEGEF